MDREGIGGNRPPALESYEAHVVNANRWIERGEPKDEEQASMCQLAVDQLLAVRTALETDEASELQPYELVVESIKARYRVPLKLVNTAIDRVRALAGVWLAKQKQKAAEEALGRERAAIEAREKANLAIEAAVTARRSSTTLPPRRRPARALQAEKIAERPPPRARIKGDYASKAMSLQTRWSAQVIDEDLALKSYADNAIVRAAALESIRKIASKEAVALKDKSKAKPGIEFVTKEVPI
jgi:hypothetical protein